MGEMADYTLEQVIETEFARDEYVSGSMSMQEAYDRGFLDEMGAEQVGIQAAWDRSGIHNAESLDREIKDAAKDFEIADLRTDLDIANGESYSRRVLLNKAVIANLYKPSPTCNTCATQMTERDGKYGKFYCCANRCPGQKAVSDSYWQSIRRTSDGN